MEEHTGTTRRLKIAVTASCIVDEGLGRSGELTEWDLLEKHNDLSERLRGYCVSYFMAIFSRLLFCLGYHASIRHSHIPRA